MSDQMKPYSAEAIALVPGTYEHYKGKQYRVLDIARAESNLEEVVIYQALYGEGDIWVRPLARFIDEVEWEGKKVPRFKFLTEEV